MEADSVTHAYLRSMYNPNAKWIDYEKPIYDFKELEYLFNPNKNNLERISDFDLKTYLTWDINTKVDRATMAYSLEARSPLLDYRVIEFAQSLPTDFKFLKNDQKRILKDVLYNYVPKEYFDRPKSGFGVPIRDWFRDELKELVLEELSPQNLSIIPGVNVEEMTRMITEHIQGVWNNETIIWKVLVLKQWLSSNGKGYKIE